VYRILDCSVSDAIYKRKLNFLTKLRHSENAICKLFGKYIVEELDILHIHLLVKLFKFFCLLYYYFLHIYHVMVNKDDYR